MNRISQWTMNRRKWMALSGAAFAMRPAAAQAQQHGGPDAPDLSKVPPDQLLLKDSNPSSRSP
jgi:hypothetical protein